MSGYKGFISYDKSKQLKNILASIADCRGIENAVDHLRLPDTDMDDKICENFKDSKSFIIRLLMDKLNDTLRLATEIANLEQD